MLDSKGKIRADIVHEKIVAMGFTGSSRTTRRIVREIKDAYKLTQLPKPRRPWLTEPGLWVQYDFADGPVIDGDKTVLFVAWLAWSRFRVVFPLRNRKMTTVLSALDRLFRAIGGVPAYVLTDNEKTVVIARHAGIPECAAHLLETLFRVIGNGVSGGWKLGCGGGPRTVWLTLCGDCDG